MYHLNYFANFPQNARAMEILSAQRFPNANPFNSESSAQKSHFLKLLSTLFEKENIAFFPCTQESYFWLFTHLGFANCALMPSFSHSAFKAFKLAKNLSKIPIAHYEEFLQNTTQKFLFLPAINEDLLSYNNLRALREFVDSNKESFLFVEISTLLQNGDFSALKSLKNPRITYIVDLQKLGFMRGCGFIAHSIDSSFLESIGESLESFNAGLDFIAPNGIFACAWECVRAVKENEALQNYCAQKHNAFFFERLKTHADSLEQGLSSQIELFAPLESTPPNALALRLRGIKARALAQSLLIQKVEVINGQDCMLGNFSPSFVLKEMGYKDEECRELLSISFVFLDSASLDEVAKRIAQAFFTLKKLRI